jgi:hypothetical protein
MRFIAALALSFAVVAPAFAQEEIARELERKGRAAEQDGGFCARASADLVKMNQQQTAEQLNRLLARPDRQRATMVFVLSDLPNGATACAYFVFHPVTMRDGKRCRPTETFLCIPNQDCRSKLDDAICEVRPGVWD